MSDTIRLETDGAIATITLNRPERMNAFTWEMIDAWAAALEECQIGRRAVGGVGPDIAGGVVRVD